jgi:hypothetical protein
MTVDEMVSEAERLSREKYPDDSTSRLAFKCGMLQGYLSRMDAEIETLKQNQQNDEKEILNLQRELIEKDN